MSIHAGHRQRLKERFLKEGLDSFQDHEVLELLLFYCIPRRDTNLLAHELISRFGSFAAVLEAQPRELKKVPGVGESVVTFLSLLKNTERYYRVNRQDCFEPLTTIEQCGQFLIPYFRHARNETVYLLCLDAKCKVLCCREIGQGSVNSAGISVRKIVEVALGANATTVVLAHNHPSGIALPSGEDVQTTRRIAAALDAVEVTLADHLVFADGDFVSMLQSGYYRPGNCRLTY